MDARATRAIEEGGIARLLTHGGGTCVWRVSPEWVESRIDGRISDGFDNAHRTIRSHGG